MQEITGEMTAEALAQKAEAAGFEFRLAGELPIATVPASAESIPMQVDAILQQLVERAAEIAGVLRARKEAEASRQVAGRVAFCASYLEIGTVERREHEFLVLACKSAKGNRTSSLQFPRSDVMLLADADKTARIDPSRAPGAVEQEAIRAAESHGVRLSAQDGVVVFGWPGLPESSIALELVPQTLQEAANWGAGRLRAASAYSGVPSIDVLTREFVRHVAHEAALDFYWGRRSRRDRESAAWLLVLSTLLPTLRRMLHCSETAGTDVEDLAGTRAFLSESGTAVTIDSVAGTRVIVRDAIGRQLAYRPDRLLAVEAERRPMRAAARPEQKPRFLSALRHW